MDVVRLKREMWALVLFVFGECGVSVEPGANGWDETKKKQKIRDQRKRPRERCSSTIC